MAAKKWSLPDEDINPRITPDVRPGHDRIRLRSSILGSRKGCRQYCPTLNESNPCPLGAKIYSPCEHTVSSQQSLLE
jgi:hypothetical protein